MTKCKPRGVFVSGTDTGVGKTIVSAGLLVELRAKGLDAVPMKPVQTGCIPAGQGLRAPDMEFCMEAAGLSDSGIEDDVVPYKFEPACSPHLAAELACVEISLEKIEAAFEKLSKKHEFIVVEGAGGVLVPLSRSVLMTDLMQRLGLPVVLVARAGLGTINHTLLSLKELRRAGLSVSGVFLNQGAAGEPGCIEADNERTIREMGCLENVWSVPFMDIPGPPAMLREVSAAHFSACSIIAGVSP